LEARAKLLKVTKRLPSALRKSVSNNYILFLARYDFNFFVIGKLCAALRVGERYGWH